MAFKMKGHTLPGINQRGNKGMKDGRANSSPFQQGEGEGEGKKFTKTVGKLERGKRMMTKKMEKREIPDVPPRLERGRLAPVEKLKPQPTQSMKIPSLKRHAKKPIRERKEVAGKISKEMAILMQNQARKRALKRNEKTTKEVGKKPPLKQTVVGGSTKADMAKDIKNQQAKHDSTKFVEETGINKGKVPSLKSMSDASKHLSNERFDAMMKEIRNNQKKTTKSPAKQTEKTTKRLLGGTKTVKRDASGKKTMVSKTRKPDKEGNVKYKTKYKHSRGKHTSKGKYSEKTGQDVGPTKETRKRKGEKKETWTED